MLLVCAVALSAYENNHRESVLYPLLDFSSRKGKDLEKGYLMGRYDVI